MKNVFKKAVSLTIALSTVAALSVSAFAANIATYYTDATKITDPTTQEEISIAADTVTVSGYTEVAGATQYAVAVVPADFSGGDADIYYVNQYDATTIAQIIEGMLLKGDLPDDDYEVRIGNNSSTSSGYETIPFTVSSTPQGIEITLDYGDVNGDGNINSGDAGLILERTVTEGKKFYDQQNREIPDTIADVNGDTNINSGDAGLILEKTVTEDKQFVDQLGNPLIKYTYTYTPTN